MTKIFHTELYGLRKCKYDYLNEHSIEDTDWSDIEPNSPYYFFVPKDETMREEYDFYSPITSIFIENNVGIVTARDSLTIQDSPDKVMKIVKNFSSLSPEDARQKYNIGTDSQSWKVVWAQEDLNNTGLSPQKIVPILYRPFDTKYTYYTGKSGGFICRPIYKTMRHMLAKCNICLISARSNKSDSMDHFFCADNIVETKCGERTTQSCFFPLYLYPSEKSEKLFADENGTGLGRRRANFSPEFIEDFAGRLKLSWLPDGRGDLRKNFGPEDVFYYMYAVFHSPTYRERYAEFLKIDFPRLPLTADKKLFASLVEIGEKLVKLHLLEDVTPETQLKFPVAGDSTVEKVSYVDAQQRVYINKAQYFDGVRPEVWEFHVGGYQVADKWLKDRKGRSLTFDDITHYIKTLTALGRTITLMEQIDETIPSWPIE